MNEKDDNNELDSETAVDASETKMNLEQAIEWLDKFDRTTATPEENRQYLWINKWVRTQIYGRRVHSPFNARRRSKHVKS